MGEPTRDSARDPIGEVKDIPAAQRARRIGRAHADRRPRGRRVGRGAARVMLVLLAVVGVATSLPPWGRAAARTALLLPELVMGTQNGAFDLIGDQVRHSSLTIQADFGPVFLDVYAPAAGAAPVRGARGGLLVIPGVGDNRQVPQLINLSQSLARAGEVVMEMTTPTLIAYDLAPSDTDAVVAAYEALAHWPGVDPSRVGIVGISGGGPLGCLAAADPRIRDRLAFVTSFGGFFDAEDYLRDIGRRAQVVNGRLVAWPVQAVPLEVLANVLEPYLPYPDGVRLVDAFAFEGASPLTSEDVANLTPEGQAAYHLLAGDDRANVDANIVALPADGRALLAALSPRGVLGEMRAPVYLLHDRGDTSIPYAEALDFAAALARTRHAYDFASFSIFDHVQVRPDLGLGPLLGDGSELGRVLYEQILVGS